MTTSRRRSAFAVVALVILVFSCSGDTASDRPPAPEAVSVPDSPLPPRSEPPPPEPPPPEPPSVPELPLPEPPPAEASPAEPPSAQDPVRFGFLHALSGDDAFMGQPSLDSARAAIGELNANGGVLGREVELVVEDSLSTVAGSVAGYNRISGEIDALGGLEGNGAIALLDAVDGDEMPTMCPVCGTGDLGAMGGLYMWGLTASFTTDGVIAAQLARDLGYTRVALLVREYPWLGAVADRFRGVWRHAVGGEITADVRIVSGVDGYSAEVQKAIEGGPEALFVVPGYDEGAAVMSEVVDSGYEGTILVSSYLGGNEIAELVAGLPEGRVLSAHVTGDLESPAYATFVAAYIEHAGKPPPGGFYEANQYDQFIALALAMTAAGSVEGPAVATQVPRVLSAPGTKVYSYAEGVAALERGEEIDYDGASSSLDMNEAGDLISPMISVTHNSNGQWYQRDVVRLDPVLSATAPVGRPPAGSPTAVTQLDFVPTDLEWEPATILTFEGAADEIVPVYDAPDGERLTFQDADQPSAAWFSNPLPLVVRVVQGFEGDEWAEVELPVRPNGSRGWIRTAGFAWSRVDHHIFVDLSERGLAFFEGDELITHTGVIVGAPDRPTPTASGFIVGKLPNHDQQVSSVVFGDWILPLSFFSEALNSFGGGLPRIALVGSHIPERMGEALTAFEVRMPNEIVEIIAREAPVGTTVRIVE